MAIVLRKQIKLRKIRSKNAFEQTLQILFILELDFYLVLAIDGLHLNGRVKHIL